MYSDKSDEVLRCPYNKHHSISRSRFQRHLVKCEKNYPPDYKVVCPYNATHRSSKSEIEEHINTCPTRSIVEASYIQPLSIRDMMKSSEEYKNFTHESDSAIFSDEEMKNLPEKIPSRLKLRHQTNGFIEGNIRQRNSHHYKFPSDDSTEDDAEPIGRGRMSNNHAHYKRFK